ncbi:ATP-binding protein, partial [Akkermansiaceae bacterium]|nr:ATP-binding protein [Akkermansiaceae bacterium]
KSLTHQLDNHLHVAADLLTIEVELEDGKPYQEWLVHINDNNVRKARDLIQVWEIASGETFKSPALGSHNLPKISGELNEHIIQDVMLPDGKKGRALGVLILPSYQEDQNPLHSNEGMEHIFVVALETSELEEALDKLQQTLALVAVTTLVLSALAIFITIRKSLVPIADLENQLRVRQEEQLGKEITIAENFPDELRGLVSEYNNLLTKIEGVRARERDFSTHAAHELRTPLAGIRATLEQALSASRETNDYKERITTALSISRDMTGLVSHLMRFSRLQSGTHPLVVEEINLHELLEATWWGYAERADQRGLRIDWELQADNPALNSDENLVRVLLSNFFDNAVSYSKEKGTITVRTHQENGHLIMSISNDPIADLPEDLDRIFEAFYRVDKARKLEDGHSGIGLSLCRAIARSLDAEISAHIGENKVFQIVVTFTR